MSDRPIQRIAIFTDTFLPELNGVAKTLGRLVEHLNERGIEYRVFCPSYPKHEETDPRLLRTRSVAFPLYNECRFVFPNYWRMKRQLREFRPDLVHLVTEFGMGICGFRAARALRIPIVSSYHTNFSQYTQHYRLGWIEKLAWKYLRWFHNKCLATFCPSETTREDLRERGFERVEVWSRGINARNFSPEKRDASWRRDLGLDDKVALLYVGRLGREKNVGLLLDAMRPLNERFDGRIHLLMVGDGPAREEYERRAPENVSFLGFKRGEELHRIYASGDVFVFASTTETFGNVVLEAMASGLPVVAAAAGGVLDSVKDGHNGYLYPPGDANALAEKAGRLIENPELRAEMSRHAVAWAHERSWPKIFDQLLQDYAEVLEKNRRNIAPEAGGRDESTQEQEASAAAAETGDRPKMSRPGSGAA